MKFLQTIWRTQLQRIVALLIIVFLYFAAQLPRLSPVEADQIAGEFAFDQVALPAAAEGPFDTIRSVHPSYERISGWISSVGAAVAINDLDGDGLSNDLCYVHTGSNQVVVAPAGDARYQPFQLATDAIRYNDTTMAPTGCMPGDLNEDGMVDILVYYWGRTPVVYLRQSTETLTTDSYLPQEIIEGEERWFSSSGTLADLDGDGHIDLIVNNYFPDGSHVLDENSTEPLHMQHSMSRAYNGGRNYLLLWESAEAGQNPSVTFTKTSNVLSHDIEHAWTLAVGTADLNGDSLPEIYFANDFGPDRLLLNHSEPGNLRFEILEGRDTLTMPSSRVVGHDSFKGMGMDFADINGDGVFDMYISNIADDFALLESHFLYVSTGEAFGNGYAPYVDQGEALGVSRSNWAWESRLADFNNDGIYEAIQATGFLKGTTNRWPELHEVATGNDEFLANTALWPDFGPGADLSGDGHIYFFVRSESGRYFDLSSRVGLEQPMISRGIATSDIDGDGDLDFAVANQWDTSYLYMNNSTEAGNYLGLRLMLPIEQGEFTVEAGHSTSVPARSAISAIATVRLPDGREIIGQVDGGNGHSGKRSQEIHFGLGDLSADTPLEVELRWRDQNGQVRTNTVTLTPGWHTVFLGE